MTLITQEMWDEERYKVAIIQGAKDLQAGLAIQICSGYNEVHLPHKWSPNRGLSYRWCPGLVSRQGPEAIRELLDRIDQLQAELQGERELRVRLASQVDDLEAETRKQQRVIIEGVMLTSDKLELAETKVTMAEYRATVAKNALHDRENECKGQLCRWRNEASVGT